MQQVARSTAVGVRLCGCTCRQRRSESLSAPRRETLCLLSSCFLALTLFDILFSTDLRERHWCHVVFFFLQSLSKLQFQVWLEQTWRAQSFLSCSPVGGLCVWFCLRCLQGRRAKLAQKKKLTDWVWTTGGGGDDRGRAATDNDSMERWMDYKNERVVFCPHWFQKSNLKKNRTKS